MPNRPLEYHPINKESSKPANYQSVPSQKSQHGVLSILLDLPTESLTHITSFLDPQSLLILSRVCKQLHNHVEDDNTWHRAFVYQFFGISPESNVYYLNCLLLRRSEFTWKNEFIVRYKLTKCVIFTLPCCLFCLHKKNLKTVGMVPQWHRHPSPVQLAHI
jgi:hypothetical protein